MKTLFYNNITAPEFECQIKSLMQQAQSMNVTPTQFVYEMLPDVMEPQLIFSWDHAYETILEHFENFQNRTIH